MSATVSSNLEISHSADTHARIFVIFASQVSCFSLYEDNVTFVFKFAFIWLLEWAESHFRYIDVFMQHITESRRSSCLESVLIDVYNLLLNFVSNY